MGSPAHYSWVITQVNAYLNDPASWLLGGSRNHFPKTFQNARNYAAHLEGHSPILPTSSSGA